MKLNSASFYLQYVRGTADALHAIVCGERRERVAAWKARLEASLDLPDPNDFDAMFPEITGEYKTISRGF